MTESLTINAFNKHYEGIALELEDAIVDFEYISLVATTDYGRYDWCQRSLGFNLTLYSKLEYMEIDLGGGDMISASAILNQWEKRKLERYPRERLKTSGPKLKLDLGDLMDEGKPKAKVTLNLEDLGL